MHAAHKMLLAIDFKVGVGGGMPKINLLGAGHGQGRAYLPAPLRAGPQSRQDGVSAALKGRRRRAPSPFEVVGCAAKEAEQSTRVTHRVGGAAPQVLAAPQRKIKLYALRVAPHLHPPSSGAAPKPTLAAARQVCVAALQQRRHPPIRRLRWPPQTTCARRPRMGLRRGQRHLMSSPT